VLRVEKHLSLVLHPRTAGVPEPQDGGTVSTANVAFIDLGY
jgi:hypothetical protein